eukprot:scaffold174850_cov31-Prasinocladus_malaysianus.AAC.1
MSAESYKPPVYYCPHLIIYLMRGLWPLLSVATMACDLCNNRHQRHTSGSVTAPAATGERREYIRGACRVPVPVRVPRSAHAGC